MESRVVVVGGVTKEELRERLRHESVELNAFAEQLFASELFVPSSFARSVVLVVCAVSELGLSQGATSSTIRQRAAELGLGPCPTELGPHLRLEYRDQAEVNGDDARHRAPGGSLTIISEPLSGDDTFPKGFYLRRTENTLWLRGYCADAEHVWAPQDRLAFEKKI